MSSAQGGDSSLLPVWGRPPLQLDAGEDAQERGLPHSREGSAPTLHHVTVSTRNEPLPPSPLTVVKDRSSLNASQRDINEKKQEGLLRSISLCDRATVKCPRNSRPMGAVPPTSGSARSAVSTSATRRSVLLRVDRRDACKRWFRSGAAGGQVCCEPEEADRRRTWASHGGFCVSAVGRIRRTPEGCVYASGGKSVQTWALTHCLTSKSSSPNSSKSIPPSQDSYTDL